MTEPAEVIEAGSGSKWRTLLSGLQRNARLGGMSLWALVGPVIGGTILLGGIPVMASWMQSHGWVAAIVYALFVAVTGSAAFAPTYVLSLLGGWTFGSVIGFAAVWIGSNAAAHGAFFITRWLGASRADDLLRRHARLQAIREALVGSTVARAIFIVTLIRLPPVFPFALTNLTCAVARTPWLAFAIGSAIGLIPRTAAVVYIGSTLSTLDFNQPRDLRSALLSIALTLIVVFVIGRIARTTLSRLPTAAAVAA
jgi:uncharacterized membrane protein YdjX (TVP38/TMEM64 family)